MAQQIAWLTVLKDHEARVCPQYGQSGVIDYIFENIKTTNKFYVEFGVDNRWNLQGNTLCLKK